MWALAYNFNISIKQNYSDSLIISEEQSFLDICIFRTVSGQGIKGQHLSHRIKGDLIMSFLGLTSIISHASKIRNEAEYIYLENLHSNKRNGSCK